MAGPTARTLGPIREAVPGSPGQRDDAPRWSGEHAEMPVDELQRRIRDLARTRNAVLLAHNYQLPEVQDVADFVGDSLGLSREAAKAGADVIVFCGVHFMAETAKILSPEKVVLLPDLGAGCSLAATITADELRAWKAEYPGAVVVSYVNTSAEVKAESDYCCTSGNAEAIIRAIPEDSEILFLPDMFLGAYLERQTGRNMHIWMGECHVHAGIDPADIGQMRAENPDADLLIHPECGCVTQTMYHLKTGDLDPKRTHLLSTEGMIRHAKASTDDRFLVATEVGILHRMKREAPGKTFLPVNRAAVCQYMKTITLPKVLWSLEHMEHRIEVDPEIARRATLAIDRMVAIS